MLSCSLVVGDVPRSYRHETCRHHEAERNEKPYSSFLLYDQKPQLFQLAWRKRKKGDLRAEASSRLLEGWSL